MALPDRREMISTKLLRTLAAIKGTLCQRQKVFQGEIIIALLTRRRITPHLLPLRLKFLPLIILLQEKTIEISCRHLAFPETARRRITIITTANNSTTLRLAAATTTPTNRTTIDQTCWVAGVLKVYYLLLLLRTALPDRSTGLKICTARLLLRSATRRVLITLARHPHTPAQVARSTIEITNSGPRSDRQISLPTSSAGPKMISLSIVLEEALGDILPTSAQAGHSRTKVTSRRTALPRVSDLLCLQED